MTSDLRDHSKPCEHRGDGHVFEVNGVWFHDDQNECPGGAEVTVSAILRMPCPTEPLEPGGTHDPESGFAHARCRGRGWLYPDPPEWAQGIIILGEAEQPIYNLAFWPLAWYWLCDRLWEDFDMYEYGGDDDQ